MRKFLAVLKARTMEFVRDRGTFFWNLVFPVLMVAGFAFAFSGDGKTLFKIGLVGGRAGFESAVGSKQDEHALSGFRAMDAFLSIPELKTIDYADSQEGRSLALDKLTKHQLDMVVDSADSSYYFNDRSSGSSVLARLLAGEAAIASTARDEAVAGKDEAAAGFAVPGFTRKNVSGNSIRYVDWLVPGVIGMNMMFSCLFGVGFVLVRYRKNGVLKRLKATPVGALNFLTAQAVSRTIIAFATSVVVFGGTNFFLHFKMEGSYLTLTFLLLLAILSMISLGLVFASRLRSEELASGLLNLVTFPMMIFSGVFYSIEGSPAFLRNAAKIFPLTHFLDAARAVMLDGAGFAVIWPEVAILGGMSVLFLSISTTLFKWE